MNKNKLMPILLGGFLLFSAAACSTSETNEAPNAVDGTSEELTGVEPQEAPTDATASVLPENSTDPTASALPENSAEDATTELSQAPAESGMPAAQEQPDDAMASSPEVSDDNLETLVLSNLETQLPNSELEVQAAEGMVTVSGKVPSQEDLSQIEPLAMQVKGVKSVDVKATADKATNQ